MVGWTLPVDFSYVPARKNPFGMHPEVYEEFRKTNGKLAPKIPQEVRLKHRMRKNATRTRLRLRRRIRPLGAPIVGGARIKSGGLTIGKYRKGSVRQQINELLTPPTRFDSKWTFQMDCSAGRVSAAEIPVLTAPLVNPIYRQLYGTLSTDGANVSAANLYNNTTSANAQYSIVIKDYKAHLKFYNSSTNTAQVRVVWYKPKGDLFQYMYPETVNTPVNPTLRQNPINTLMLGSNKAVDQQITSYPAAAATVPQIVTVYNPVTPVVGDGTYFDYATAGANMTADYSHAGWPLYDPATTTASNTANTVARLDPSLVPGSPQVKQWFNKFWTPIDSEEFKLEPGNQYNSYLRIRNRMIKNNMINPETFHIKGITVIGVVYVMGQMVFNDTAADSTITYGSTQISVMREDTCSVRLDRKKNIKRLNLTNGFVNLANANQAIINPETGNVDDTYDQDE